jgi:hypothetical protein
MKSRHIAYKKKVERGLTKSRTEKDVREVLLSNLGASDPKHLMKATIKLWDEYLAARGDKAKNKLVNKVNEKLTELSPIVALDNHYLIAEALVGSRYRTLMLDVTSQLVAEYDCETASEKILAETAAWAYCRMIEYSCAFSSNLNIEFLSNQKNGYYSMLSKEVDRANRQYLTAISTLKFIKQPPVNLTFKAGTAFVAQNQQINAEPNKPPVEDNTNAGQ